jgi:putative tryptophan/tyrosine transport system substrate-binding protein
MKRKILSVVWLILGVSFVDCAEAQQAKKIPRIGFLVPSSASGYAKQIAAFQLGLRDLGYSEGKNIVIEYRYSEGKRDPLAELAAELVRLKVDAIVTASGSAVQAVRNATQTIPIIFAAVAVDPVKDGLISSFARPGANITGLTILAPELDGKRLELLKETLPKVTRVGFLWRTGAYAGDERARGVEAVAEKLGLRLQSLGVGSLEDIERVFEAARRAGTQALIMTPSPLFTTHRAKIVASAARNRLPAMYTGIEWVEAGGLMGYGPDVFDNWRRAATYVDKILKGAKPADLPVEQPMKFEFVVNLKTAKQIGRTIPPNVLARADKVIR